MTNSIYFPQRKFIKVSGTDSAEFLQGLITNDVHKLANEPIIFAAFLNANGRFLYDFFIWCADESYIIDISDKFADDFLKKLKLYKIRKNVSLELSDAYQATIIFPPVKKNFDGVIIAASDPRRSQFATRLLVSKEKNKSLSLPCVQADLDDYNNYRIKHLLAEGDQDLEQEKAIILEYGYNDQNAISYDKGCYLGQELITRTYRVGVIRKKLVSLIVAKTVRLSLPYHIEIDGKKKATLTSVAPHDQDHNIYLALVKDGFAIDASYIATE